MVQNNKVLTVSYGTFSCTLEGFEDSFGTMKAIAEYFRDLAADDRYFGAEPPQPDTEMLARIAEREIARQVEARRDGNGFVLRAAGKSAPALASGIAAAQAAPDREPVEDAAPETAPRAGAQPIAEPEAPAAPEARADDIAPDMAAQDAPAAEVAAAGVAAVEEAAAEEPTEEPVAEDRITDFPAEQAGEMPEPPEMPEVEMFEAEEVEADLVPATDSIAAKLQRIRAVVSRNEQAAAEAHYEEEYTEDLPSEAYTASAADDLAQALAYDDAEDDIAADDDLAAMLHRLGAADVEDAVAAAETEASVEDLEEPQATPEAEAEEQAEPLAKPASDLDDEIDDRDDDRDDGEAIATAEAEDDRLTAEAEPEDAPGIDMALAETAADVEPEAAAGTDAEAEAEAKAGIAAAAAAGLFDDLDTQEDEDDLDDDETNIMSRDLDDDLDDDFDDEDDLDDYDDARNHADTGGHRDHVRSTLARVVKIKRSDFEAAIESGQLEEIDEADEPLTGSLSPEDEADLMRELAEVEAELEPAAEVPATPRPRPSLSASVGEDEPDLSRLMDEAGEKLSDPEAAARRETYSHLRAAVATTKAERSAGGTMGSHPSDDPYRDDLASVVRPRRPESTHSRPLRPATETRPAPLKLVAEQRIDDGAGVAARGPVHPRRVTTQLLDDAPEAGIATPEGGFAEFAAEVGATELPELLEAAAAYMSFVEGRAQFSRPQLMNKVRQVETGDFNREDGLRSFGQLLRDGKIEKKGGGRFAASGRIGFRPDDERAAG